MKINGTAAIVSGGASGLGEATVRELAASGSKVVIADLNPERGKALAEEVGGIFAQTDVSDADSVRAAVAVAASAGAPLRFVISCAGIGWAQRTVGRDGEPHDRAAFGKVIDVNLIGTFNLMSIGAAAVAKTAPADDDGARGVRPGSRALRFVRAWRVHRVVQQPAEHVVAERCQQFRGERSVHQHERHPRGLG